MAAHVEQVLVRTFSMINNTPHLSGDIHSPIATAILPEPLIHVLHIYMYARDGSTHVFGYVTLGQTSSCNGCGKQVHRDMCLQSKPFLLC